MAYNIDQVLTADVMRYALRLDKEQTMWPDELDDECTCGSCYVQKVGNSVTSIQSIDNEVKVELERRRIEALKAHKIDLIQDHGDDGYPNGTILTFFKKYTADGIAYRYVVLKVNDKFYSTAMNNDGAGTWQDLVYFLISGEYPVGPDEIRWAHLDNDWHKAEDDNSVADNITETQVIPKHVGIYPGAETRQVQDGF